MWSVVSASIAPTMFQNEAGDRAFHSHLEAELSLEDAAYAPAVSRFCAGARPVTARATYSVYHPPRRSSGLDIPQWLPIATLVAAAWPSLAPCGRRPGICGRGTQASRSGAAPDGTSTCGSQRCAGDQDTKLAGRFRDEA